MLVCTNVFKEERMSWPVKLTAFRVLATEPMLEVGEDVVLFHVIYNVGYQLQNRRSSLKNV